MSCFHRGKYQDAKNYFAEGAKHDSSTKTGLNQWMIWCDEKMEKVKNAKSESAVATAASGCSKTEVTTSGPKNSVNSSEDKKSSSDQVVANIPEQPKIKHDWYQTETTVVIEVRIKGLNKEQVSVEFQPRELNVSATIPQRNNAEYNLDLDLAHEIQPERCTFKVLSTKLEIKMLKKDGIRWTVLEGEDPLPVPVDPLPMLCVRVFQHGYQHDASVVPVIDKIVILQRKLRITLPRHKMAVRPVQRCDVRRHEIETIDDLMMAITNDKM